MIPSLSLSFDDVFHDLLSLGTWIYLKSLMNWLCLCILRVMIHSSSCSLPLFMEIQENGEILSFVKENVIHYIYPWIQARWKVDEIMKLVYELRIQHGSLFGSWSVARCVQQIVWRTWFQHTIPLFYHLVPCIGQLCCVI